MDIQSDTMLCAGAPDLGGRGLCSDTDGGPLLTIDGTLVGVLSFGNGCAPGAFFSTVYSRVSAAYTWISNTVCHLSDVPPSDCFEDIPTLAPTEDGGASDSDGVQVKFVIQYDAAPFETFWTISQRGRIFKQGPIGYVHRAGEKLETEFLNFPAGETGFVFHDSGGNGMGLGEVLGFFEILQSLPDGTDVILASGDHDFLFSKAVTFTVGEISPTISTPSSPLGLSKSTTLHLRTQ